jgi:hypothetical protein
LIMFRHNPLFEFKHGDHACLFYRDEDSLREVLAPYIAEGLRKGERCFCAQNPRTIGLLAGDLQLRGIPIEQEVKRGALEIHTDREFYFPNGVFQPTVMLEMLRRLIEDSVARGFAAFRIAGDTSWAARSQNHCEHLIRYEAMIDRLFPGKAATALCQYHINHLPQEVLAAAPGVHKLHLAEMEPHSLHASVHLSDENYAAEIVANRIAANPSFYFVVHQRTPEQLLGWGVAPDFGSATRHIEEITRGQDQLEP